MATITHAREAVIQALYAMDAGNEKAISQIDEILKDKKVKNQKAEFAKRLLEGVVKHLDEIDEIIKKNLRDWTIDRLDMVDRQILRLATYEMKYTDTPFQIVIDEAVKIAKNFSEEKSKSFINGVLDTIHKYLEEN